MSTIKRIFQWIAVMGIASLLTSCVIGNGDDDDTEPDDTETDDPEGSDGDAGDTGDEDSELDPSLTEIQGQWRLAAYEWEFYRYENDEITETDGGQVEEAGTEYITFSGALMTWQWNNEDCFETWEVDEVSIDADDLATDPGDNLTGFDEEDDVWFEWATQISLEEGQLIVTLQEAEGSDADYVVDVEIYIFEPSEDDIPPADWNDTPCES